MAGRCSGSCVVVRGSGVGGELASSADRVVVGAGDGRAGDHEDRVHVREPGPGGLHNFNADGFDSLAPKYAGGRPPKFTLPEQQQIKKIALSRPQDHGLPFSTWSLSKLAEFLVAGGWSTTSAMRASALCSTRRACRFN
jgi:hypothetical protein